MKVEHKSLPGLKTGVHGELRFIAELIAPDREKAFEEEDRLGMRISKRRDVTDSRSSGCCIRTSTGSSLGNRSLPKPHSCTSSHFYSHVESLM